MVKQDLTELLNKGIIKVKKKKTLKKKMSPSAKEYNKFLKKKTQMSNIKNPISNIISYISIDSCALIDRVIKIDIIIRLKYFIDNFI